MNENSRSNENVEIYMEDMKKIVTMSEEDIISIITKKMEEERKQKRKECKLKIIGDKNSNNLFT
jgi:hypothetical protein